MLILCIIVSYRARNRQGDRTPGQNVHHNYALLHPAFNRIILQVVKSAGHNMQTCPNYLFIATFGWFRTSAVHTDLSSCRPVVLSNCRVFDMSTCLLYGGYRTPAGHSMQTSVPTTTSAQLPVGKELPLYTLTCRLVDLSSCRPVDMSSCRWSQYATLCLTTTSAQLPVGIELPAYTLICHPVHLSTCRLVRPIVLSDLSTCRPFDMKH